MRGEFLEELQRKLRSTGLRDIRRQLNEDSEVFLLRAGKFFGGVVVKFVCMEYAISVSVKWEAGIF